MSIEDIRNYCIGLPYVTETMPFDDTTIVYKVGGKWFAVTDLETHDKVVVKCDPDIAIELRDRHEEVTPAWHFNKRHWNAISLCGDLAESFIYEQIRNSYMLVINKNVTPRALRMEILAAVKEHDSQANSEF
ncbi:MAG: MmcQ/YjbR family DNA-binding protein [Alistipes sp.]|jgi:predicted DNA-binding protein (MmcQ/YjbR family)|nr:MmcQ/YjbR family DNA-binding protein [Alistipes sp.]